MIGVPIWWRTTIIGSLVVFSRDPARTFGPDDADLLSLEHGSPDNAFNATRRTVFFHTEFRF